jgi:protein-S-isoprenylcysteine O-methyltransferase Ste14
LPRGVVQAPAWLHQSAVRLMHLDRNWLFPAAWIAWGLYWAITAFGAKPTRRAESTPLRLSHDLPLLLAVLLLAVPRIAGTTLRHRFLPASAALFWIGAVLLLLGLAFCVAARRQLGGNWSGNVTLKHAHSLVRSGPYRLARHPIYSGILLAVLGSVIALGEWRGLVALLLILAGFLRKIRIEEQYMLAQFGAAYRRYQAEVAALVPGLL